MNKIIQTVNGALVAVIKFLRKGETDYNSNDPAIVQDIKFLAKIYGWQFKWYKPENTEIYFRKKGCGLAIWHSKMTVRTSINHPKHGKTQLYRKRVDMEMLEDILNNPRVHTNKGYTKKTHGNRIKN